MFLSKLTLFPIIITCFVICQFVVLQPLSAYNITPQRVIVKLKQANKRAHKLFRQGYKFGNKTKVRYVKGVFDDEKGVCRLRKNDRVSKFALQNYYVLQIDSANTLEESLQSIKADADVESATPSYVFKMLGSTWITPNDALYTNQWALKNVQAEDAWKISKGSSKIKIAVIDSGVDYTHPDLKNSLAINSKEDINNNGTFEPWANTEVRNGVSGDLDGIDQDGNGYIDDVLGWNFTNIQFSVAGPSSVGNPHSPGPNTMDFLGHGTNVSGVIAAEGNNQIGIVGLANECKVMPVRVFSGLGEAQDVDIVSAIIYAVDNGARVINMSLGGGGYSNLLQDAIQYAIAHDVVVVAAAGNEYVESSAYPSAYSDVICVTGINNENVNNLFNYGYQVDLAAPGVDVYATKMNGGYETVSGTSFSSPMVAACSGLILSVNENYTPMQVRGILKSTANNVTNVSWNIYTGAGWLNAYKALVAAQNKNASIVEITSPRSDDGAAVKTTVDIKGTVTSTQFSQYSIFYQIGDQEQKTWTPIVSNITSQKISDVLAKWDISSLVDNVYTLRLVLTKTDGTTAETRIRFYIDTSPPVIQNVRAFPLIVDNAYQVYAMINTNKPTLTKLYYRVKGSVSLYSSVSISNSGTYLYANYDKFSLPANALGVELECYVEARSYTNLKTNSPSFSLTVPNTIIPDVSFEKKLFKPRTDLNMKYGKVFPKLVDIDRDGKNDVLLTSTSGAICRLYWNGLRMQQIDSVYRTGETMFVGDVKILDTDNRYRMLAYSFTANSYFYKQTSPTTSPFSSLRNNITNGVSFAIDSTKGNTETQVVGRSSNSPIVLDTTLKILSALTNPNKSRTSSTAVPSLENGRTIVADFDKNGTKEFLFGDRDGNFFMYEWNGSSYVNTWNYRTGNFRGSDWLGAGKILGNGKTQFVIGTQVGFKTTTVDTLNNVWRIELWETTGNNQYAKVWSENIYSLENSTLMTNKRDKQIIVADIDKDGIDEVIIAAQPSVYVFKRNSTNNGLVPYWSAAQRTDGYSLAVFDMDKNGSNEIVFSGNGNIEAWEYQSNTISTPINFSVEPIVGQQIKLSWSAVTSATGYNIYRTEFAKTDKFPSKVALYQSNVASIIYNDNVLVDKNYLYSVQAIKGVTTSDTTLKVFTYYSNKMKLASASNVNSQLTAVFSEEVSLASIAPEYFQLRNITTNQILVPTSALLLETGKKIALTFLPQEFISGLYELSVSNLRGKNNVALDDAFLKVSLSIQSQTAINKFYIVSNKVTAKNSISITFSRDVDPTTALLLSNYKILPTPITSISQVQMNVVDKTTINVLFSTNIPSSVGYDVQLKLSNLKSTDGVLIDSLSFSNVISLIKQRTDLELVYSYPNPFRFDLGKTTITFANLTQKGTIQIFTLQGNLIRELSFNSTTGGTTWDLSAEPIGVIASGVYVYKVTNDADNSVKVGKIAIIR